MKFVARGLVDNPNRSAAIGRADRNVLASGLDGPACVELLDNEIDRLSDAVGAAAAIPHYLIASLIDHIPVPVRLLGIGRRHRMDDGIEYKGVILRLIA